MWISSSTVVIAMMPTWRFDKIFRQPWSRDPSDRRDADTVADKRQIKLLSKSNKAWVYHNTARRSIRWKSESKVPSIRWDSSDLLWSLLQIPFRSRRLSQLSPEQRSIIAYESGSWATKPSSSATSSEANTWRNKFQCRHARRYTVNIDFRFWHRRSRLMCSGRHCVARRYLWIYLFLWRKALRVSSSVWELLMLRLVQSSRASSLGFASKHGAALVDAGVDNHEVIILDGNQRKTN